MALFKLKWRAREQLQKVARVGTDARQVRRAQAWLWLDEGSRVSTVARRLGLTRRAIYHWMKWYEVRAAEPMTERVRDRARSGRPSAKIDSAQHIIGRVWSHDPRRHGYRALVWTVPMLRCQIQQETKQVVSLRTVRRALHKLRYRYKRPRLVLARRLSTWRQAKGGLNAA